MGVATKDNEFDVIIVGGGITGAGTARDCALRGLKALLELEKIGPCLDLAPLQMSPKRHT